VPIDERSLPSEEATKEERSQPLRGVKLSSISLDDTKEVGREPGAQFVQGDQRYSARRKLTSPNLRAETEK